MHKFPKIISDLVPGAILADMFAEIVAEHVEDFVGVARKFVREIVRKCLFSSDFCI